MSLLLHPVSVSENPEYSKQPDALVHLFLIHILFEKLLQDDFSLIALSVVVQETAQQKLLSRNCLVETA
jgi:hypothetical protein